jgi:hypothetical protein
VRCRKTETRERRASAAQSRRSGAPER